MKLFRKILQISSLIFISTVSYVRAQPYTTIERVGRKEGLINNTIFSIEQDSLGMIWIGTENGLARFDGNNFKIYRHDSNDSKSLAGNSINKLLVDKEGLLWIATKYKGLDCYDTKSDSFIHYISEDKGSISGTAITDIASSYNGNLWIATYYDGLNYYNKKSKKFENLKATGQKDDIIKENIITSIWEDRKHQLWIGYNSKGLTCYNLDTGKATHYMHDPNDPNSIPSDSILEIIEDSLGNMWFGTKNGLTMHRKGVDNFLNFKHDSKDPQSIIGDKIMSICEMNDGSIWIGTENGGISIIDLSFPFSNDGKIIFQNIAAGDSIEELSNDSVYSLFQDCYGNIWIGTYRGGINFISNLPSFFDKIQYVPFASGQKTLNHTTAWGITEDKYGYIWIGTDGGGINILNPKTHKIEKVIKAGPKTIGDNAILCALTDSRGRMWFGTYDGGLTQYNQETKIFKQYKHNPLDSTTIPSMDIRTIYETSSGKILIGTMGGLAIYNETGDNFTVLNEKNGLPRSNVRSICEDNDGNIWLGTYGVVSCLKDFKSKYNFYCTKEKNEFNFNHDNTYSIHLDKAGVIWLGTDNGLCCWKEEDKKFKYYSIKEGLEDNVIRAITEDNNGFLWLSTNMGISRFDPTTSSFTNYNYNDGVPLGEFMDNSCLKSRDGKIWFGSSDGICWFYPQNLLRHINIPNVRFTNFELFNEFVSPNKDNSPLKTNILYTKKIRLKHDQNVFTIHYSISDFSLEKKTIFRYKMEGLDTRWIEDKESSFATYKNVAPGKYKFLVEASINNVDWSGNISSLEIEVLPPFWLTWWMKIIYFLLIIATTILFIHIYMNKMKMKRNLLIEQLHLQEVESLNKEKLHFFTNISHDIKTPLTLILSPIEDLMKEDFPEESHNKLVLVEKNAKRLLKMFNRLLDFRKIEQGHKELSLTKGNIIGTIMDVCISYKELREKEDINFYFKSNIDELNIWYDTEKVWSIIDNLISNAFKYTDKGEISVNIDKVTKNNIDYVEIKVKDTGIGLDENEKELIFDRFYQVKSKTSATGTGIGLSLVKAFIDLHKGYIYIESTKNIGSCFQIGIPCNLYPKEAEIESCFEESLQEGKLLMIIDDNPDIREYVKSCFNKEFKVITSNNGNDALEIINREMPEIIISDIMMEGMDGIELCRKVKSNKNTCHIPVILLTAKTSLPDKQEGYDAGADSYVTKPFSSDLLITRVHNILDARKKITDFISKTFFNAQDPKQEQQTQIIKQNKLIQDLIKIIEENMEDEQLDMEYIASSLYMSYSSLYRKVKSLTGLPLNEFIRGIRMKKAKELLLTRNYSISEVSFKVGINSPRYFRQCFKEHYGMTPTDFLKQNEA